MTPSPLSSVRRGLGSTSPEPSLLTWNLLLLVSGPVLFSFDAMTLELFSDTASSAISQLKDESFYQLLLFCLSQMKCAQEPTVSSFTLSS